MRSLIYETYGEPADVLTVKAVPDLPQPGPGTVLVRMLKRPIHPGDLIGIRGGYRSPGSTAGVAAGGAVPGFEGYGVVAAVGDDVSPSAGLREGVRVAVFPARAAWSDYALVPARFATPIPDEVSDAAAAQLHVTPLTAALLLRAVAEAGAGAGDLIAVSAAGAAVAKLATALALRRGLAVIGVVRSREGAEALAREFPDVPVVATEDPDWRDQVIEAAAGRSIRVVLDPVGGPVASDLVGLMADGGTLVSYGNLSGQAIAVPALWFSVRDITLKGVSVGRWAGLPDDVRAEDLATTLELAKSDARHFAVAAEYDLAEIADAARHAERPGKAGSVLLTSLL